MTQELYEHQRIGIDFLVSHDAAFLADEMGLGKTRQAIEAASKLLEENLIDIIIVACPAAVVQVWRDEIFKWLVDKVATERFMVFSYDWLKKSTANGDKRTYTNVDDLLGWTEMTYATKAEGHRRLLILDESTYVKNRASQRSRAILELRKRCSRCWLLSGTPIANSPLDLWSQMVILERRSMPYKNYFHFRWHHADIQATKFGKKVVKYKALDELYAYVAPYMMRRLKSECLDLPPKTYLERHIPLDKETWQNYKTMRDELLLEFEEGQVTAAQAGVRFVRLAQITSGYLNVTNEYDELEPRLLTKPLSREKLDHLLELLDDELAAKRHVLIWCRFVPDILNVSEALRARNWNVYTLYGGTKPGERKDVMEAFGTVRSSNTRNVVVGHPATGGMGLTLVAADTVVYYSQDFNWLYRVQSEDRCHRVGQQNNVTYITLLAAGPQGQRTIDHVTHQALKDKANTAYWTLDKWREELG